MIVLRIGMVRAEKGVNGYDTFGKFLHMFLKQHTCFSIYKLELE